MTTPLIDRDALAQALRDTHPLTTLDVDAVIAYLRTVITPEALSDAHFYGRSMDTIDLCEKFVRAIFGEQEIK